LGKSSYSSKTKITPKQIRRQAKKQSNFLSRQRKEKMQAASK